MEDNMIIDLYFDRSEQAIAETQSKYGRLCGKIAGSILSRPEDAEEAVSTSYLKLWNAIPPKRPESLCGYLCTIVRNTALNTYDRIKRRPQEELYGELAEIIPDSRTTEEAFDSKQIAGFINEFLGRSPKRSRDIFTARYYFNMSVKDIAAGMNMTESAVKTRLSRIRTELRSFLKERGIDI